MPNLVNLQLLKYTIYSSRDDGTEYKFGEMEGGLAFGFINEGNFTFPKMPESYGAIKLQTGKFNFAQNQFEVFIDHELMPINPVENPFAFLPGSPMLVSPDASGALTTKNPSEVTLRNNLENTEGLVMRLIVSNCTGETVECAPKDEVLDWLTHNKFMYFSKLNFINYEEVSLTGDHVQAMFDTINILNIGTSSPEQIRYRLIEHRVSLEDSLY